MDSTKSPTIPMPRGHGAYSVESDSRRGTFYEVDTTGAGFCTCRGFEFHGTCKHLTRAIAVEGTQQATIASLREQRAAARRACIERVNLDQCQTCHARPAAAGYAECGFCRMDAVFGCAS